MKLSQLTTGQLADVLVRLTPPLCRIIRDERTMAALDAFTFTPPDSQPPLRSAALLWEKLLPLLLTDMADDLYAVLAILTEKSPQALRNQCAMTTLHDLAAIWDQELMRFFFSAGSAQQAKS